MTRLQSIKKLIIVASLFAGVPAFAEEYISWAKEDIGSYTPTPSNALGAPDGQMTTMSTSCHVYLRGFNDPSKGGPVKYEGLSALLGLSTGEFKKWDLIAFEGQGGSAPPGGGWESSIWFITDQIHSVGATFNENTGIGASTAVPLRFKTGSISAASYRAFFKIPSFAYTGSVVSWLLIDIPDEVDMDAPQFRVWASGANLGEGTPDPDSFGRIYH